MSVARAGLWKLAAVLPAVALLATAAACGDRKLDDEAASPGAAAPGAAPAGNVASAPDGQAAAPQDAPPPRDPLAEAEDSIAEAQLFHKRQQSMESYASCMEKAKGLEPGPRAVIEAACKRGRGAQR
ncbi:MAG TPA: hypothetical protein VFJ16_21485 [Longimicrobium sp.]|nr:hypothetical protein [Longimicrobium sp.]